MTERMRFYHHAIENLCVYCGKHGPWDHLEECIVHTIQETKRTARFDALQQAAQACRDVGNALQREMERQGRWERRV